VRFYKKVAAKGGLTPDLERKTPLCMTQYGRVFATARIPLPGRDAVYSWTGVRHIVVLRKRQFFTLDVLTSAGEAVAESHIHAQLDAVVREADRPGTHQSFPIGALTAEDRDAWSAARAELVRAHPINVASLEVVDRALFVLVLEDEAPADLDATARLFLHGDVRNRWFDKLQFLVCANGVAGVNMEHSPIDGHTILRLLTEIHNEVLARNGTILTEGPTAPAPRYHTNTSITRIPVSLV
jgi:carnitine O-acetyltransferase